jgi:hypothetical protein
MTQEARQRRAFQQHCSENPWRLDWLADDAVHSEPVSALNSLLTGKNTGKFIKGGPWGVGNAQISRRFGDFRRDSLNNQTGNFWRENREIIFENREFCLKLR